MMTLDGEGLLLPIFATAGLVAFLVSIAYIAAAAAGLSAPVAIVAIVLLTTVIVARGALHAVHRRERSERHLASGENYRDRLWERAHQGRR